MAISYSLQRFRGSDAAAKQLCGLWRGCALLQGTVSTDAKSTTHQGHITPTLNTRPPPPLQFPQPLLLTVAPNTPHNLDGRPLSCHATSSPPAPALPPASAAPLAPMSAPAYFSFPLPFPFLLPQHTQLHGYLPHRSRLTWSQPSTPPLQSSWPAGAAAPLQPAGPWTIPAAVHIAATYAAAAMTVTGTTVAAAAAAAAAVAAAAAAAPVHSTPAADTRGFLQSSNHIPKTLNVADTLPARAPPPPESDFSAAIVFAAARSPGAWLLQNQEPAAATTATVVTAENGAQAPPASAASSSADKHGGPSPVTAGAGAAAAPSFKEGSSYAVYDTNGEPSSFDALLASLESYDVVLLGEYHDDPVAHRLQLRLLRHVLGQPGEPTPSMPAGGGMDGPEQGQQQSTGAVLQHGRRSVALSLEMFERDVQGVVDEYWAGVATEADLMKDARPWPNYVNDYRPMVLAAKEAGAPVICANAPRRYVSLVGRSGSAALATLPPSSRRHLPPLPLRPPSQQYIAKIAWTMQRAREAPKENGGDEDEEERAAPLAAAAATGTSNTGAIITAAAGSGTGAGGVCPHIGLTLRSNFVEAQNLWDATMADSIAVALKQLAAAAPVVVAAAECEEKTADRSGAAAPGEGVAVAATAAVATPAGRGGGGGGGGASSLRRPLVVHVCGKFHSEQRLGICEHLTAAAPTAAVCVVTFVPSGRGVAVRPSTLTTAGLHTYGDWLVLTDGTLPRSFESHHPV